MADRKLTIYFDKNCLQQLLLDNDNCLVLNLLERDVHLWLGFHEDDLESLFHAVSKNQKAAKIVTLLFKDATLRNIKTEHEPLDLNEIKDAHTIFFLDASVEECKANEKQYGMLFLNYSTYKQKETHLFSSHIFNVSKEKNPKNKLTAWTDLKSYILPCNSLVIIDNYIIKETEQKKIEHNLIPILENLLPLEMQNISPFYITIVTIREEKTDDKVMKQHCENCIKKINTHFSTQRPYKVEISIILTTSEYNHDRNIFTNYQWFHSGNSFSYFNKKGDISAITTLFYYPIFHLQKRLKDNELDKTAFWSICALLEEANSIIKRTTNSSIETNVFGNKQNRLLQHGI
jgi:hypothetical protein